MKVVLVFPRFKYPSGDPPLGLMYIGAFLKAKAADVEIKILDTTFNPSFNFVENRLKKENADIVGIYMMSSMYKDGLKVAEIAKSLGSKTIIGGPHATVRPDSVIKNESVDAVCIGEGEITFYEFVKSIEKNKTLKSVKGIWFKDNGKIIKNTPRQPIENLDNLPFPSWELIYIEMYFKNWFQLDSVSPSLRGTNIMAARGCPFSCTYCQPTLRKIFGPKVRIRSPSNVVKELETLVEKYTINAFMLQDDTLTAFKPWIKEFCSLLLKKNLNLIWGCNTRANSIDKETMKEMRKAGLRKLFIGAESANQRILDDIYKKGIKVEDVKNVVDVASGFGIKTQVYFMLGAPTETKEEIINTINFAVSLNADEATFSITTPLPETDLFEMMKRGGWKLSENFEDYDYYKTKTYSKAGDLSQEELDKLKRRAFIKFYLSPKRLKRTTINLFNPRGFRKIILKLKRL